MIIRELVKENRNLSAQVQMQYTYYKRIESLQTELRDFRHDIENHIFTIQSLYEKNLGDKADAYAQSLMRFYMPNIVCAKVKILRLISIYSFPDKIP